MLSHIELHDPDHKIPFAIVNNFTSKRVLTGADFDIESLQRAQDGTLWFGDEFGPFLLHTDADGRVLHAPYPLPDPDHPGQELRAPQNPLLRGVEHSSGDERDARRRLRARRPSHAGHLARREPTRRRQPEQR